MFFRLLLFLLAVQLSSLHAQQTNEWALNAGLEVHHFAKATPSYFTTDLHFTHKRSLFAIGYSFSLNTQYYQDDDLITPDLMRIPTLNLHYTFKFVDRSSTKGLSLGTTIGYKYGHWRHQGVTFTNYYQTTSDTNTLQITHVVTTEKWESDQHHFYLSLFGEYPLGKVRLNASFGMGVVLRGSYQFDHETTYYNQGSPTKLFFYHDVTPMAYLSRSWYAKLGLAVPFSVFRKKKES